MTNEVLAKRIAENGRQLVLEKYDWNNIAKQMQNTLSHIIAIANIGDSKNSEYSTCHVVATRQVEYSNMHGHISAGYWRAGKVRKKS